MNLISRFALLFVILEILYLLISGNLLSTSPFVITGQVLAVALNIAARWSFRGGKFSIHAQPVERPLLSTGPYQYIRHPMYASALLLIWSGIFGHIKTMTVLTGLIVTGIASARIIVEERLLRARYPEYSEYSKRSKRLIPFII